MERLRISTWTPSPDAPAEAATRLLPLWDGAEAFALVAHPDPALRETAAEIVANALASALAERPADDYGAFSQALERANRQFAAAKAAQDLSGLDAFAGMFDGSTLHFSVMGKGVSGILAKDGRLTDICGEMRTDAPEFGYVSSGRLAPDEWVYASSADLREVAADDLASLSGVSDPERHASLLESLYAKAGLSRAVATVVVRGGTAASETERPEGWWKPLLSRAEGLWSQAKADPRLARGWEWLKARANLDDRRTQAWAFGAGIVACAGLLYFAVAGILSGQANMAVPEEYKEKLAEARRLVDGAARSSGDRAAAGKLLADANKIIFEVRSQVLYMAETQSITNDIAALRRELNGVATAKADRSNALWTPDAKGFSGVAVVQSAGKPWIVGADALVGPVSAGGQAKRYAFPDGETAVSAAVTANGKIYVLTRKGGVLEFSKESFRAVAPDGPTGWPAAAQIAGYDQNLYFLSADGSQVVRFRPNAKGGFSEGSNLLPGGGKKASSIAVDGGVFLLNQDMTVDKAFTAPEFSRNSIILNGLPDGYEAPEGKVPLIVASPDLNYVYVLLGGSVWVFDPGTKNPRAVTALKYLGQIEASGAPADGFLVPRDGEVTILSAGGAYALKFDVVGGRLAVRE